MNIKQHIEAGHYPKDSKGRALVPTGHTFGDAVICATDKPGRCPIIGWVPTVARVASIEFSWDENGWANGLHEIERLLPPPPRKVKVTRWMTLPDTGESDSHFLWDTLKGATEWAKGQERLVIELTGEYEEPWA